MTWKVTPKGDIDGNLLAAIGKKLNDGRMVASAARTLDGAFSWARQPEGEHFWGNADDLVTIEWVDDTIAKIEALKWGTDSDLSIARDMAIDDVLEILRGEK